MNAEISRIVEEATSNYTKDQYGLYLRKSRQDLELEALGEEETLARHKSMLMKLADKHGISPEQITIYHEMVSGDSIEERPEMQRLIDDVFAKKYKGVLVVEIERLARGNTKDQGEVAEAFQYSHTKIITPAKVYNPDSESDQEYFEFALFMSRREYNTIKRRLKNGKKASVEEGNYVPSRPPFGFDAVRKSKKDRILVKNDDSKFVQMAFDWYTEEGKSTSWIARQFTLMGLKTYRGGKEWERSTIKEILFNPNYIGKVRRGMQEVVKAKDPITGKTVKKRRRTGKEEIFEGKHEGFIAVEQFEKVKELYGKQAPAKMNLDIVNPLAGMLVCAHCGRAIRYIGYYDGRAARYHHAYGVHACKIKSATAESVLSAVIDTLKQMIEDYEIEMTEVNTFNEAARHQATIEAIENELKSQLAKKRRLFDSWEANDGTYTRDEFVERKTMYTAIIEKLQAQLDQMKDSTPVQIDYSSKIMTLHQAIDCIQDPDIDGKAKNDFLKSMIEKITFDTEDLGYKKGAKPLLDLYLR